MSMNFTMLLYIVSFNVLTMSLYAVTELNIVTSVFSGFGKRAYCI